MAKNKLPRKNTYEGYVVLSLEIPLDETIEALDEGQAMDIATDMADKGLFDRDNVVDEFRVDTFVVQVSP
jgi:hypothetical protein